MAQQENKWKVFVCHSSDDKDNIARPLVDLLRQRGTEIFYDEYSIRPNDDLDDEIHKGLEEAKGGITIVSKAFLDIKPDEREFTTEELFVLTHKRKIGEGFLISIYYDVEPKNLPEKYRPLKGIIGIKFKSGDSINAFADKVYKIIEDFRIKEIKSIQDKEREEKKKRRKKIAIVSAYVVLITLVIGLLLFIIFKKEKEVDTKQEQSANSAPDDHTTLKSSESTSIQTTPYNASGTDNVKSNNNISNFQKQTEETEDYGQYINSSFTNTPENVEVSVVIVNDTSFEIEYPLSYNIANIYSRAGKKGNIGLLKSSFIKKPEFQDLFNGNSDIIEKLKLDTHTDYLVLGKLHYNIYPSKLEKGNIVCNTKLTMSIISASDKSIIKSFTIPDGNGSGVTKSQAIEYSLKYLSLYYEKYYSAI